MSSNVNWQMVLAGVALIFMGVLGVTLLFQPIPTANREPFIFILGALSGILTTTGVSKVTKGLDGDGGGA